MIVSCYWVSGVGDCLIHWNGPPEDIIRVLGKHRKQAQDDGHNGFWGTKSLPDDLFPPGVQSIMYCFPPCDEKTVLTGRSITWVKAELLAFWFGHEPSWWLNETDGWPRCEDLLSLAENAPRRKTEYQEASFPTILDRYPVDEQHI